MIALLVLISNCVNTTGEFILGKTVEENAQAATAGSGTEASAAEKNYIGQFYADFYFWVNLFGAADSNVCRLADHAIFGVPARLSSSFRSSRLGDTRCWRSFRF